VRVDIARIERDRLLVTHARVIHPVQATVAQPQVVVKSRVGGMGADGFPDRFDRLLMAAGLVGDDTQQVQRIAIIGQHSVNSLGLLQTSRLVMLDRGLELGRHRARLPGFAHAKTLKLR
jgi:hypothetical protein